MNKNIHQKKNNDIENPLYVIYLKKSIEVYYLHSSNISKKLAQTH